MDAKRSSLLEGIEVGGPRVVARAGVLARARARLNGWAEGVRADPVRRERWRRGGLVAGAVLGVGLGVAAYAALRPVPKPDYLSDEIRELLDYTLLTDEFNNLPVRERVELLSRLVGRLKGMSAGESAMMAAFAAGIAGSARDQMEANMSRLVVDAWDEKAREYGSVPAGDREGYLEGAYVEFEKMLESVAGVESGRSDQERIDNAKREARRGMEQMRGSGGRPSGEAVGRLMTTLDKQLGQRATPTQRARGLQMLRDMTRHFRGEDVSTGKPRGGG